MKCSLNGLGLVRVTSNNIAVTPSNVLTPSQAKNNGNKEYSKHYNTVNMLFLLHHDSQIPTGAPLETAHQFTCVYVHNKQYELNYDPSSGFINS